MRFTIHKLIKKDSRGVLEYIDLSKILKQGDIIDQTQGTYDYVFNVMAIDSTSCFIEVKYGRHDATDCFDKQATAFKKGILSKVMVHTQEQFFIYISFNAEDTSFYISDINKKSVFINFCESNGILLKTLDLAADIDEFVAKIKQLNTVKLKSTHGMFLKDYLNPKYNEDWGAAASPQSFFFKIRYNCEIDSEIIKKQYKKMNTETYLEDIEFEGVDANDQLLVFNSKSLLLKKEITVEKQEDTGYYDPYEVKRKLLETIK
jgi:hypothetical protein